MGDKKCILFFPTLLLLFSYNSNCQEQNISGTYKLYEGSEGSYKYYSFNDAGYFEFHEGGCLGEFSYGKGDYEIKNDSIYFYYQKYNDQEKFQSHQVFKYRNDSDKIKLSVNVFDQDSIPLEGANVYFQENLASTEPKGGMVDNKGNILLEKNKTDEIFKINISHLGYKPQKIYLFPEYNYVVNTFLKKKTIKGELIKNKVVKFKLIEIDDNFLKLENNGNIEKWYKSKQQIKTFNNYYFQLSWSGGMLDTEAFDALPDSTQQDIQAANVAEGQAINMATDDANGVKNCN